MNLENEITRARNAGAQLKKAMNNNTDSGNIKSPTPAERAEFDQLCAAQAVKHALNFIATGPAMTPETAKVILASEASWLRLIDAAKKSTPAPAAQPATGSGNAIDDAPVGAPAKVSAATSQSAVKSAPAATPARPATAGMATGGRNIPAPHLRPALDTRPAHTPPRKLAGL